MPELLKRSRRIPLRHAALVAILFLTAGTVAADDWPQWRGPERDGVWRENGIVERFGESDPRYAWRVEIGEGYGGPAVADGRVFVTDFAREAGTTQGTEQILVLDEATGDPLWSYSWAIDTQGIQQRYANGPRATPTIDGDRAYVLGSTGRFFCFDVADGSIFWESDWVEEYGAIVPTWGITGAPLVDGDKLIALVGGKESGKVMAFDKRTGEELWRAIEADSAPGYSPPVIVEEGGTRQLIVYHPTGVASLNPETGEIYWSQPVKASLGQSIMSPVYSEGMLYVSSSLYGTTAMALDSEEPLVDVMWQSPQRQGNDFSGLYMFFSTPFVEDGTIYGVGYDGLLRAVDAVSGVELWQTDEATEDARQANAFVVKNGDRFFITNDRGDLIIAKLSREGYEEIDRVHLIDPTNNNFNGRRELGRVNWVHPAYANGHILIRNDNEIVRASLLAE